ncbi:hypothetical protein [Brevibacillus dissolubilis]|uniref:hypothetical protein n=1 Tax=Brevibacillus dissolubilis TaxID=1844116 RepID=UPI00159B9FAA|nr:hypothetical protein [Brevibacillus dissolubilis]
MSELTAKPGRWGKWTRYIILFVFGAFAGGVLFLFLYGKEMEELMLENRNLYLLNERLLEDIDNLKQSQKVARKRQDLTIEEIKVTILDPKPNAFIETEVVRHLEKDLGVIKGKKTDQVAEVHGVLHEMLRRREYIVEGKMVEVRIKTLVISRTLHLFVTVEIENAVGKIMKPNEQIARINTRNHTYT